MNLGKKVKEIKRVIRRFKQARAQVYVNGGKHKAFPNLYIP